MAHLCGNYHYGNQDMIRPCCVQEFIDSFYIARKVAMTRHHRAYEHMLDSWNSLTESEMREVESRIGAVPCRGRGEIGNDSH